MPKHCRNWHLFKFLNQIWPKGTLIIVTHHFGERERAGDLSEATGELLIFGGNYGLTSLPEKLGGRRDRPQFWHRPQFWPRRHVHRRVLSSSELVSFAVLAFWHTCCLSLLIDLSISTKTLRVECKKNGVKDAVTSETIRFSNQRECNQWGARTQ